MAAIPLLSSAHSQMTCARRTTVCMFSVETPFGPVLGKLGWLDGRPPTFAPEYEDCARVARERDVPLREVYHAAQAAYHRSQGRGEPDSVESR